MSGIAILPFQKIRLRVIPINITSILPINCQLLKKALYVDIIVLNRSNLSVTFNVLAETHHIPESMQKTKAAFKSVFSGGATNQQFIIVFSILTFIVSMILLPIILVVR